MPTFTMSVSELLDSGFDFGLEQADYPIFDETYRDGLNTKILRHYYNYEIGHETPSMFRFALNRKMNEIMPYYNQLYESTKIQFDPLSTMNYTDVVSGTTHVAGNSTDSETGTTSNTSDTTSHADNSSTSNTQSRAVHSDFPQNQLSGDQDYASSMDDSTSAGTGTGSQDSTGHSTSTDTVSRDGTGTTTEDSTTDNTRTLSGYNGAASELLMNYRRSLLNIDMEVITQLKTLFMGLWDNGDEFTGQSGLGFGGFGYGYW